MRKSSPNRGVVLSLVDAYALHRYLEFLIDDRRFWSPIEAYEAKKAFEEAKARLEAKLLTHAAAYWGPNTRRRDEDVRLLDGGARDAIGRETE